MQTEAKQVWAKSRAIPANEDDAIALERILPEIARRLFTVSDSQLEELPRSQFKTCAFLLDGRHTISQIATELHISVSAVTQVTDRLEKVGLVERVYETLADGGDRRYRYVQLTEHGREMFQKRREHRQTRVAEMLECIPPERHAAIRQALETMLAACKKL